MTFAFKFLDLDDIIYYANKYSKSHLSNESLKALFNYYNDSSFSLNDPIDLSEDNSILNEWKEISINDFLKIYPDAKPLFYEIKEKGNEIMGCINVEGLKETYGVLSIANGKVLYNTKESDLT